MFGLNSSISRHILIKLSTPHTLGARFKLENLAVNFLRNSDLLIGNSSAAIIESTYFHLPVVNIGNRQKGREASTNILLVRYDEKIITKTINKALSHRFQKLCNKAPLLYGDGKAAQKIVFNLEKLI